MLPICQNIARYRKLCGYTQEQLAEHLGVTAQSVSKWENGITNPDVSLLPILARSLSVDINALFLDTDNEPKKVCFTELPELCYDSVLSLYLKAQWTFSGRKETETEEHLQERINKMKKELAFKSTRCADMINEGSPEHGVVFLSDAFTFIDRSYGGDESTLLFDIDKAGEMLSVLGDRNVRRILKAVYKRLIEGGEKNTFLTPEQLAKETDMTLEAVNEAAVKLRHIRLLDETEELTEDGIRKEYSGCYYDDFISVLAILRLAYFHTSDTFKTVCMYRDANNYPNYGGDGL